MTDASINREKFSFTLPFDIALDSRYDASSLIIDIDNFYYEVINNEFLKVNIDVYIDGEKIEEKEENFSKSEDDIPFIRLVPNKNNNLLEEDLIKPIELSNLNNQEEEIKEIIEPNINYQKPTYFDLNEKETACTNNKDEFNIFQDIDNSDTYVTYHVYIVKEGDTIDSILKKYEVKKESLSLYNDLENIKIGTKLIIPYES